MNNGRFCKFFLAAPIFTLALIINSNPANAEEISQPLETEVLSLQFTSESESVDSTIDGFVPAEFPAQVPAETDALTAEVADVSTLSQVMEYGSEGDEMGQVTSISQLSDVQPTDWAFQALQSLVERYGCIAGYPDGTYRGRNFMTRYEFAAGLNACMDRVSELIAAGLADAVTREDLATLQRLQEEFAAELATLRGRVDALEARVAEVEANQFSTTTKLNGEVIFFVGGVIDEDEAFDSQVVFSDRVRLNFDSSFSGEDRLRVRFQAENTPRFDSDQLGFQFGGDNDNSFEVDDLHYSFPIGDRIEVVISANGLDIDNDFSTTISPLDSSGRGAISEFADPAQYEQAFPGSGAGAGASVLILDNDSFSLSLDFGYVADNANDPEPGQGLFNGEYATQTQLTLLSDLVDIGIMYSNSYASTAEEFTRIGRVYDVGFAATANTFGAQANFKLFDELVEIGGGVAYSHVQGANANPDFDVWSWQGTLAINDVGGDGNLIGILAGVPSYTRELPGQTRDTGFLAELFYRYNLNRNIAITPSIIWLADPFNDNETDDTIIGSLRTTFRF